MILSSMNLMNPFIASRQNFGVDPCITSIPLYTILCSGLTNMSGSFHAMSPVYFFFARNMPDLNIFSSANSSRLSGQLNFLAYSSKHIVRYPSRKFSYMNIRNFVCRSIGMDSASTNGWNDM